MASKKEPMQPGEIAQRTAKAKAQSKPPALTYKKIITGKAAKKIATQASAEQIAADRAENGRVSGFSLSTLKDVAKGNRASGGGTVLPHSGVMGGLRMSDQMEPAPTDNAVTERVINRKPYNFSPTPMKNSPGGTTPEQEEAQKKYIADSLATPEGQAYTAKWEAIRKQKEAEAAELEKSRSYGQERREF